MCVAGSMWAVMHTLCAVARVHTRTKTTKSFCCFNSIGFWRFLYRVFTLALFLYINSIGCCFGAFPCINSMGKRVEAFLCINSMENSAVGFPIQTVWYGGVCLVYGSLLTQAHVWKRTSHFAVWTVWRFALMHFAVLTVWSFALGNFSMLTVWSFASGNFSMLTVWRIAPSNFPMLTVWRNTPSNFPMLTVWKCGFDTNCVQYSYNRH